MAARKNTEDNYYTRAQYQELVRSNFAPVKVYEDEDGREFFIQHPRVLDDDTQEAVDAAVENGSGIDVARAYLGGDYDAFKSGGGQSWMVGYQLQQLQKREQGVEADGTPTT